MKINKNRNIILIGYMGSGKSTVGRKAAKAVEYNFLDTDVLIEQEEGMSITKLFEEKGEPYFREKETETIRRLIEGPKGNIIATGGGLPMKEGNAELLKKLGTVIYLKAETETLMKRLSGSGDSRPLLQNGDLRNKIETMLAIRGPVYEATADLVLQTDNMSFYEIICQIEKLLRCDKKLLCNCKRQGGEQMKILVINGPNLNFLGIREKGIYGSESYDTLIARLRAKAEAEGIELECFQDNSEGAIIDRIQKAYFDEVDGIIINPGAYAHYSIAIRDALASVTVPKIEVHISNVYKREEFRHTSVVTPVCDGEILGLGLNGYLLAMDAMKELCKNK